jgi:hypothetical protein
MLGVTKGIEGWNSQKNNVERLMDNASYTSAHPDDTLVLAGPPRFSDVQLQATTGWDSLLPIGMMQTFQLTSQKPTQPLMAIGSGRSFFVSGKSQTTWRIGRLFCNGRNLLRVLYHNVAAAGINIQNMDDPPVPGTGNALTPFYINLDSELFYIPFGLGVIFRDKAKDNLGAGYLELSMLNTYTMGFTAGQNMIMEDVGGMCDRVFPFSISSITGSPGVPRVTIDQVIGFADVSAYLPTGNPGNEHLFENNNPSF